MSRNNEQVDQEIKEIVLRLIALENEQVDQRIKELILEFVTLESASKIILVITGTPNDSELAEVTLCLQSMAQRIKTKFTGEEMKKFLLEKEGKINNDISHLVVDRYAENMTFPGDPARRNIAESTIEYINSKNKFDHAQIEQTLTSAFPELFVALEEEQQNNKQMNDLAKLVGKWSSSRQEASRLDLLYSAVYHHVIEVDHVNFNATLQYLTFLYKEAALEEKNFEQHIISCYEENKSLLNKEEVEKLFFRNLPNANVVLESTFPGLFKTSKDGQKNEDKDIKQSVEERNKINNNVINFSKIKSPEELKKIEEQEERIKEIKLLRAERKKGNHKMMETEAEVPRRSVSPGGKDNKETNEEKAKPLAPSPRSLSPN